MAAQSEENANKPFLSDIKAIRKRARENMENGAVTGGYAADRDTVINKRWLPR